ncbi:MAG TPA: CPBP family intramembrane glutamic endopeptidase [Polyangia bacterium]|nr:CPBP family intramembrane glutamic endopeptidase [Polyangia bacterium]
MTETRGSLKEPLLAFVAATALAAAFAALGAIIPRVREYLHVLIAVVFFETPFVAAKRAGRDLDYRDIGLRVDPVRLNLAVIGVAVLITFPAFVAGFFIFYDRVCAMPTVPLARAFAPLCHHWLGWGHGHLHAPANAALLAAVQLIVVAIPEELFFRGYLMERLEQVWPPTRRLFGAKVGWALVVSSVLFALGHLAVIPNPQRLAVFFPALVFGWMRARTGSIAAGALFHALCNLLADLLHTSYFG